MATLPSQTPTIDAIFTKYQTPEVHRAYLGCSAIGDECRRKLWLGYRMAALPVFTGRQKRIFETGHIEEARILNNLRSIGLRIDCEQLEVSACDGHLRGHIDAAGLGFQESPKTWHLIECKTSNTKNFSNLVKHGVKESKPAHFAQMQIYMGLLDLTRAAYIVCNKDNDDLFMERIRFDEKVFKELLAKAQSIISSESPPERISRDKDFYLCKFCNISSFCWGEVFPEVNCRTCAHGSPGEEGAWLCAKDLVADRPVCADHIYLPSLLHWLEPIGGDPEHVIYKMGDRQIANVSAKGFAKGIESYSSRELKRGDLLPF